MKYNVKFSLVFILLSVLFYGITKYFLDFNSWYASWVLCGMFAVFNGLGYYERHAENETN